MCVNVVFNISDLPTNQLVLEWNKQLRLSTHNIKLPVVCVCRLSPANDIMKLLYIYRLPPRSPLTHHVELFTLLTLPSVFKCCCEHALRSESELLNQFQTDSRHQEGFRHVQIRQGGSEAPAIDTSCTIR